MRERYSSPAGKERKGLKPFSSRLLVIYEDHVADIMLALGELLRFEDILPFLADRKALSSSLTST